MARLQVGMLALGALVLSFANACATRPAPYRFRAPLLSSVRTAEPALAPAGGTVAAAPTSAERSIAELPARHRPDDAPPEPRARSSKPAPAPPGTPTTSPAKRPLPATSVPTAPSPRSPTPTGVQPPTASPPAEQPRGPRPVVPTPTSPTRPEGRPGAPGTSAPPSGVAATLRGRVGLRDKQSTHLSWALTAVGAIGVQLDPGVRSVDSGLALVQLASERGALSKRAPLPGDLVFFDRTDGETEASLVGVVIGLAEREQMTVEFVYLARRVVRRGYLTPSRPAEKRDEKGRSINTFVRHLTSKGRKSDPFLAGQLFRTFVRIERLSR